MNSNISYCSTRLQELDITYSQNSVKYIDENGVKRDCTIFTSDPKSDDILIHYVGLNRNKETYYKSQKERPYIVRRLKNPCSGAKYISPSGASTRPFFPPQIIQKYQEQTKIKTLILTEGQFKAFKGCIHDIDVIGISGIHNLKNKDKDRLNGDIAKLIEACQVENVVFLVDADLLDIRFNVEQPDKDLAVRLQGFCTAVNNFKELMKAYEVETYFAHIKTEYAETAKGLDDLLMLRKTQEDQVAEDLLALCSRPQKFFYTQQLSKLSYHKLAKYFHLKKVEDFYEAYRDILDQYPFTWRRGLYQWKYNDKGGEVEQIRHPASYIYIRVGCEYYKLIYKLNAAGEKEELLKVWKVGEIQRDYAKGQLYKKLFEMIPKYDCFTNVPDHTENYRREIEVNNSKNYNLYHPLPHKPVPGDWSETEKFLRHIFQEQYLMGLDYLTILYRYPLQKQYILCLVNEQRKTGKSTFLFFLRLLFVENVSIASSNDFQDNYNDIYASKLLICIDEGFIDKKHVLERLKSMATSPKINLHGKHRSKEEIDFFAKLVLTSNDERNFVNIDDKEIRFWVVKVPQFKEEDPDLLKKIQMEIPAFIHELKTREIFHPRKTRMWFEEYLVENEALRKVRMSSKSWIEQAVIFYVKNMMIEFGEEQIFLTPKDIIKGLKEDGNRFNSHQIADVLKQKMKLERLKQQRYRIPVWHLGVNNKWYKNFEERNGRPYAFKAEDYLDDDELKGLVETKDVLDGKV